MAETPSKMIALGTEAPAFTLLDSVSNRHLSLETLRGEQGTVIMFICNHCPYVKLIQDKLAEVAKNYQAKGINFIAINANDVQAYPDDRPEMMRIEAERHHYTFPYLFDETQAIAKAYEAACTPDFYLFDKNLKCVYRGRFDNATPGNHQPVTGSDLTQALDQLLIGKPIHHEQFPSLGCNIKWKRG